MENPAADGQRMEGEKGDEQFLPAENPAVDGRFFVILEKTVGFY